MRQTGGAHKQIHGSTHAVPRCRASAAGAAAGSATGGGWDNDDDGGGGGGGGGDDDDDIACTSRRRRGRTAAAVVPTTTTSEVLHTLSRHLHTRLPQRRLHSVERSFHRVPKRCRARA